MLSVLFSGPRVTKAWRREALSYTQTTHPTLLSENGEQERGDKDKDNWEKNQGQGVLMARRAAGPGRLWERERGSRRGGERGDTSYWTVSGRQWDEEAH